MKRTNATGQLLPLNERTNEHQQEMREAKIWARKTVADKLAQQQMIMGMTFASFVQMTFIMKLRWLFFGHLPNIRLRRA